MTRRDDIPRAVARGLAVAIGLLVGQLAVWARNIAEVGPEGYLRSGIDFLAVLTGGRIIRDGNGRLLYDLATQRATQVRVLSPYAELKGDRPLAFNHPPFEALLAAPLIDLPYPLLYALWSIAAILALGAALYLLCGVLPLSRPARWTMIAAACSYQPVHIALWQGQTSTFMLLGLCGAYAALARRREALAGAALTLLAFKPQFVPVVLLLLVLRRHWVALASFAGLLGGVYVAALPVLGAT